MTLFYRLRAALLLSFLTLFALPVAAKPAPAPAGAERTAAWNADTTDLDPDPSIIYGRLPNGLRYAIRPNNHPANQVLVRMTVDVGSAAETDEQQGLAHFIEHMAFNGSAHVPEGDMVKMLERLGLSFGADTNASTGYLRTTYKLDLPNSSPALIDQALFLMRETASELTIAPDAVDRERGVVIAEMRLRENYAFQSSRALNSLYYPGSYYSTRYPIGKLDVLQNAPADRLRALYDRWYRPDRARIVVVGPVDPVAIEKQIVAKFSSWKAQGTNPGDIDVCTFDTSRPAEAAIFTHPEVGESLNILQIVPDRKRPDNFETSMLQLKMNIAGSIIARRIARKSRSEDVPYLNGGLTFSPGFCDKYARIGMSAAGKDGSWRQLLPFVEQITRQAAEYGFTQAEVDEQVKRLDTYFANAAKSEATQLSSNYAETLAELDDEVVNSAQFQQLLWMQIRPFMTPQAIGAEYGHWYGQIDRPLIFLAAKTADGADSRAILDAWKASQATPVAAPDNRDSQAFGYTDFGSPGKVVSDVMIKDLGIRAIRFANGVMLNLKKTDFEDNRIRYSLKIDGGDLAFGVKDAPLGVFMSSAYSSGGLGKHDYDDLQSLLAGTTVSAAFNSNDDYFGGFGVVAPADLELQMDVLAAYATDPGYRPDAMRLFRRPLPESYARLYATPGSALSVDAAAIMTDNDPRFALAPLEKMQSIDFDQLKAKLGNALLTNRLEIGMVGDLDEQAAIAAVAKTFGAMPARKTEAMDYSEALATRWSQRTGSFDIGHRGEANQLGWRRVWTTAGDTDQRETQGMDLLAKVVTIRLIDELRENLGAAYGASASSSMSDLYPGRGTFSISTNGDPKDLAEIEKAVDDIMREILVKPVDTDLFERARKPVLESYADWRKRNPTWIALASEAQTRPDRLERFRTNEANFRSLTPEYLWQLAQKYLSGTAPYTFRAIPETMLKKENPAGTPNTGN